MLSDKEVWMRAYCAVLPTIAAVPNDTHIADVDAYVQGVAMVAKLHATQAVKALHECYPTNEPPDLSAETLAAMRCARECERCECIDIRVKDWSKPVRNQR